VLKEFQRRDILAGMAATAATVALPAISAAAAPEMMHAVINFGTGISGKVYGPEDAGMWYHRHGAAGATPDRIRRGRFRRAAR
jgi:hypothetical protein